MFRYRAWELQVEALTKPGWWDEVAWDKVSSAAQEAEVSGSSRYEVRYSLQRPSARWGCAAPAFIRPGSTPPSEHV